MNYELEIEGTKRGTVFHINMHKGSNDINLITDKQEDISCFSGEQQRVAEAEYLGSYQVIKEANANFNP